jgi:lytic transglycosylase
MNVCKSLGMLAIALLVSTSHCAAMTATEIVYDTVGDNDIANAILYYCEQNGVDPLLATATFETESGFNQAAISSSGAIGITQLMPSTAASYGLNPYNQYENIEAGVRYLSDNLNRYSGTDWQATYAIAAYNAGPGAVDAYGGVPPYGETIDYVNAISDRYSQLLSLEN